MYSNELMDVVYESLDSEDQALNEFTIGSVKKFKELAEKLKDKVKDLKELKDSDITEYSDPKAVKKYIDKSSELIQKSAKEIEEAREEGKKAGIKAIIRYAIEFVASYGLAATAIMGGPVAILAGIGTIAILIDSINGIIKMSKYEYANKDIQNELSKLKGVLKKLEQKKGLKDSDKDKIAKCINKIEDAQKTTDQTVIRTTQEASWEDIYEQYVINESFDDIEESYDPWKEVY